MDNSQINLNMLYKVTRMRKSPDEIVKSPGPTLRSISVSVPVPAPRSKPGSASGFKPIAILEPSQSSESMLVPPFLPVLSSESQLLCGRVSDLLRIQILCGLVQGPSSKLQLLLGSSKLPLLPVLVSNHSPGIHPCCGRTCGCSPEILSLGRPPELLSLWPIFWVPVAGATSWVPVTGETFWVPVSGLFSRSPPSGGPSPWSPSWASPMTLLSSWASPEPWLFSGPHIWAVCCPQKC